MGFGRNMGHDRKGGQEFALRRFKKIWKVSFLDE
jgi:hypothetical protein